MYAMQPGVEEDEKESFRVRVAFPSLIELSSLALLISAPLILGFIRRTSEPVFRSVASSFSSYNPSWVVHGVKYHLALAHLLHSWDDFGSAIVHSTESHERSNGRMRIGAQHSNGQATSLDVGRSQQKTDVVAHLISGGHYRAGDEYSAPGAKLLALVKKHSIFSRLYGLVGTTRRTPGQFDLPPLQEDPDC